MADWVRATLAEKTDWDTGLRTFRLKAPKPLLFQPGQFANLGVDIDGERVRRAYSIAGAPGVDPEFYIKEVGDGAVTPRLFRLNIGDELWLDAHAAGVFTLGWLPPHASELWLLGTGTGLGPYISMLRAGVLLPRFERVVVVHGVRVHAELGYREELLALAARDPRFRYVPLITREEPQTGVTQGRIPERIVDGRLEEAAGFKMNPDTCHIFLCGNPDMIVDTTAVLESRGLRKHKRKEWGHYTTEKYW